jgi:hypothetical protein
MRRRRDGRGQCTVRAAIVLAAVSLAGGGAPAEAGARPAALVVPAPRFARLPPGWTQLTSGPVELTRRGANAYVVALSWPYRLDSGGWASAIPRDGIAVQVFLIRRESGVSRGLDLCLVTPHLDAYPLVTTLPLRLPRTTRDTLEGSRGIPEYRIFGRLGESYDFEVRVDVNRRHPTARRLRLARAAVAAIRFPRWPNRARC